jgi:signal peptidase I
VVKWWKLELLFGVPLIAAVLVLATFYGRWRIPQAGMFPTYPEGAHLVARKKPYRTIADVARGDVVIFRVNKEGVPYDYTWRVVGLPGERIAIHADAVSIDGRPLATRPVEQRAGYAIVEERAGDRTYQIALPVEPPDEKSEMAELRVPRDHVFLLGDNRHNAVDSRLLGPIPFGRILARVSFSW